MIAPKDLSGEEQDVHFRGALCCFAVTLSGCWSFLTSFALFVLCFASPAQESSTVEIFPQ